MTAFDIYIKGMISVKFYTVQTVWIKIETAIGTEAQERITAGNFLHVTRIDA